MVFGTARVLLQKQRRAGEEQTALAVGELSVLLLLVAVAHCGRRHLALYFDRAAEPVCAQAGGFIDLHRCGSGGCNRQCAC